MAKTGFIYSTVDGHTLDICRRLVEIVEAAGDEAVLIELTPEADVDLAALDQIVIGASIRYGKHRPEVARFINDNADLLATKKSAFFSVNAVARKAEKKTAQTNPYVKKFLQTITWKPSVIGIFGGRIHYAKYGFWDRTMIRFIMWLTKGPTDPDTDVDFTDWDEVTAFGEALCARES